MSDKLNLDDILYLGKYDYSEDEKAYDLDEILGISVPKIETEIKPVEQKNVVEAKQKDVGIETAPVNKAFISAEPVSEDPELAVAFSVPDILVDTSTDDRPEHIDLNDAAAAFLVLDEEKESKKTGETKIQPPTQVMVETKEKQPVPEDTSAKTESKEETVAFSLNVAAFDQIKAKSKAAAVPMPPSSFADPLPTSDGANDIKVSVTEKTKEEPVKEEPVVEKADRSNQAEPTKKKKRAQVIDDYSSIDEREDILAGLKTLLRKITGKMAVMSVLFLGSIYLMLGQFSEISVILPAKIRPTQQPETYCLVALILSAVYILLNFSPLFDGFKKMFRGRLTADGISLCLGLCSLLYNIYFWFNPQPFATAPLNFDIFFGLSLLMNLIGKRLLVKHIYANFELISEDRLKAAIGRPKSSAVDNDVMVETGNGGDVLYAARIKTLSNYMDRAFAEQNMNRKTDVFYFIVFALIVFTGLTCWIFKWIPLNKIIILVSALMSVAAAVFATWSHTLYVYKLGNCLRAQGTMISGREGAKAMAESGVLVVRDTDLMSDEDISLHGMQIRNGYDLTEILLALSALYHNVGGPLDGFFGKILDENEKVELPEIKDAYYHDQLGYTFVADDCRMAVGNAELMHQLKIEIPAAKNSQDNHIIYVAVNNILAGIFSVSYKLSMNTTRSLRLIESEGLSLAVISNDFNLQESLFAQVVCDPEIVTLLSHDTGAECERCCKEVPKAAADIVTYERIRGMAAGLVGCSRLLSSCNKNGAYKITATVFGIIAVTLVCLLGGEDLTLLPVKILLFHILWNLPNVFRALRIKI